MGVAFSCRFGRDTHPVCAVSRHGQSTPGGLEYTTARHPGRGLFLGSDVGLGQGYGTQLLTEFVVYIKAQWQPRRIIADPAHHSVRSVRVAHTCGFILDEETGLYVKEVHEAAPSDAFQSV